MRITPLDVRKQEFRKSVRGFDCDEVRAFLTTLADEYETVLVDNKQLRERIIDQDEKISEYKTMERTLRDTLMTAERLMQETRENANREGDLIVKDARIKSKQVLQECRVRTEELRRELVGLRKEKETYLARFQGLAQAQIEFIASHKNDFEDLDKRMVEMVDSVIAGVDTDLNREDPDEVTTVETATAAEPTTETSDVPQQAQTNTDSEVDVWRDYAPGTSNETDEAGANETSADSEEAETATTEGKISAAVVDMATMGIPVAAVPFGPKTHDEATSEPAPETMEQAKETETETVAPTA